MPHGHPPKPEDHPTGTQPCPIVHSTHILVTVDVHSVRVCSVYTCSDAEVRQ